MDVLSDIDPCRNAVRSHQRADRTVGLVPTMGALHQGHLSLIRASKAQCDATAVTIFVNPTQFAPGEDFSRYPRPLENDLEACRAEGVDIVFTPDVDTVYPDGSVTTVHVAGLTDGLCGPHRPGHFDGVATVVTKLFNMVPANRAFFGEKDYQQLAVVRRMTRDLNLPIEIIGCPTVREPDGLAMSSRNAYLSASERKQAAVLSRALFAARERIEHGEHNVDALRRAIRDQIAAAGPSTMEYVEIVDAESLDTLTVVDRPARICLAVRIGHTRLIDNVGVDAPGLAG